MKRTMAVLMVMAFSWSMTSAVSAQSDDQNVQKKTLTETVKSNAANEKMMPAPKVQLERLTKGLKLTEEQQKQIKPIIENEYAKLNEIRHNDEISPKKIQKLVEDLRVETKAKINGFLTPEQRSNYTLVNNEINTTKRQHIKQNRKDRIGTKSDQAGE